MDQGLLNGAVVIDLRKAFDTVDHDLLLENSLWDMESLEKSLDGLGIT